MRGWHKERIQPATESEASCAAQEEIHHRSDHGFIHGSTDNSNLGSAYQGDVDLRPRTSGGTAFLSRSGAESTGEVWTRLCAARERPFRS
jgi:hypothetical protein